MAADAPPKPPAGNPCCREWQGKYAAMKSRRDAFKQTVGLLENAFAEAQAEISRLKQTNQEEGVKTEFEKESKEKESAARSSLEKEVRDLKSEISSLQKRLEQTLREKNEEVKLLLDQASKGEKEISQLKELLRKETVRADNAKEQREKLSKGLTNTKAEKAENEKIKSLEAHVSEAKKEISQLKKLLDKEKLRAESESKKAESERKKGDRYLSDFEALRTKADQTSSDLVALSSKFENASKQLEAEKQKTIKERKRADLESAKAKAQKKLVGQNMKRVKEEKARAETLSQQLEMARARTEELQKEMEKQMVISKGKCAEDLAKIEEQRRLLEMNEKIAMDWKSRADNLAQQLEEARLMIEALQKQVDELSSSQRLMETLTFSPHKVRDVERAEVRILKKELKFERKRVKHAKQLAKLEKIRKDVLLEELGRLKLEFVHFSNRLNLLDGYFSTASEVTDVMGKRKGCRKLQRLGRPFQVNLNSENKRPDTRCDLVAGSGSQKQGRRFSAQLVPRSGRELSESVSGTVSESKSLIGGSNKTSLESSGVNSTAISFSDGQFVASQGRGQLSLTTSAEIARDKLDVQPTNSSMSPRVSNTRNNSNLCLVAENYLQSPHTDIPEVVNEYCSKRKRMVEAIESIEYLYSEDKKLHLQIGEKLGILSSMLVGNVGRPLEERKTAVPGVQIGSSVNYDSLSKKRKASCEKNTIMQNSYELKRLKKIKKADAKTCENPRTSGETPQPGGDLMRSTEVSREKICDPTAHRRDATTSVFEEVAAGDYMKLLELDKSEDEKYFKMAIESPLSPRLPEIDFQGDEMVSEFENPPSCLDLVAKNMDDMHNAIKSQEVSVLHTRNASMAVGAFPISSTGDEYEPVHGHIVRHFVVLSIIKDQSSIVRIFHAAKNCIDRCPSVTKAEWAVSEIVLSLKMEENLSILERACVLLSLMLHNYSMASVIKIGSSLNIDSLSCLDSFSRHIQGVVAEIETGGVLSELLDKLLDLLKEFLLEQKVLCSVESSETAESDSRISIPLDGENVVLYDKVAPTDQLVAGSAILAAICAAVGRIGFVCEASFEMLYKHSHGKTSVLLTILHVFLYIAGEKIFTLREHSLSITVLKSIIMFLENRRLGTVEGEAELHPGTKCPFSDRSSSLEVVASMLLEILQKFAQSNTMHQSLTSSLVYSPLSRSEKTKFSPTNEDFQCIVGTTCEASCCLGKNQSRIIDSVNLCQLCDILSLVELLAGYMEWDWTCANVVALLLKMLELPLAMDFSVAIVSLLGQVGSIGVDARGYEDQGIENLRDKLSAFLQCETTLEAGFGVQIATVSSLLKLSPLDFQKIIQSDATLPGTSGVSVSANLVAKWFSLLSQEQQNFSSGFFQSFPLVNLDET